MFEKEILIVDDNDVVQFLHKEIVSMTDFKGSVKTFANGKDALFYLYQRPENAGRVLVLLDINMPVMNGWEFLDALPKMVGHEKVQVAVISSSVDEADREKSLLYPQVLNFCEKPINVETADNLINKVFHRYNIIY